MLVNWDWKICGQIITINNKLSDIKSILKDTQIISPHNLANVYQQVMLKKQNVSSLMEAQFFFEI